MTLLGGAAASSVLRPFAARAQQQPALPVVGFLNARASGDAPQLLAAFRQGLKDTGFVEGRNVTLQYHFAGNHNERLPALVADLIHSQVFAVGRQRRCA
jgi:putative tryptophan/tyrosine transport system substrate-binding protein